MFDTLLIFFITGAAGQHRETEGADGGCARAGGKGTTGGVPQGQADGGVRETVRLPPVYLVVVCWFFIRYLAPRFFVLGCVVTIAKKKNSRGWEGIFRTQAQTNQSTKQERNPSVNPPIHPSTHQSINQHCVLRSGPRIQAYTDLPHVARSQTKIRNCCCFFS